ncbi:hypothetical protein [Methylobacterium oxalidis]|uniref:Uncharacterized protein n=1 Tax=Methylobacterium oxalidis TaxID=944322 RepID=A0A512JAF1_9HYPH|nr:hypothetical protein [Methylobacterium oxalidis]GEP06859.1 hypothetical protein MOX02_48970 [Methylobacterium oxalidis]GJE35004.1 hypothetical protein LDDCCGHA_5221 [Methylobacterium oxalidis]GLS67577.1 hypothetical protein GCM10007888_59610 [Methylobacterium oxalidis]
MATPTQPVSAAPEIDSLPVEGTVNAPILFFDEAPTLGTGPGIGRVTLSALVQEVGPNGAVSYRRVAVAHLRGNKFAFESLREAINRMELLASPTPGAAN